jgi:hypothetical protein
MEHRLFFNSNLTLAWPIATKAFKTLHTSTYSLL